jgi:hypothetical protein
LQDVNVIFSINEARDPSITRVFKGTTLKANKVMRIVLPTFQFKHEERKLETARRNLHVNFVRELAHLNIAGPCSVDLLAPRPRLDQLTRFRARGFRFLTLFQNSEVHIVIQQGHDQVVEHPIPGEVLVIGNLRPKEVVDSVEEAVLVARHVHPLVEVLKLSNTDASLRNHEALLDGRPRTSQRR